MAKSAAEGYIVSTKNIACALNEYEDEMTP
jgi:hypothetical protein